MMARNVRRFAIVGISVVGAHVLPRRTGTREPHRAVDGDLHSRKIVWRSRNRGLSLPKLPVSI